MNPKKINGHTLPQFIAFLNETLIPDLKKSGTEATAEDFESAVKWIKELQYRYNDVLATTKKLVTWGDVLRRSAGIEPDAKGPLVADIKEARAAIAKSTS